MKRDLFSAREYRMRKLGLGLCGLLSAALVPMLGVSQAGANDFVDTRLNLTLTNENVLAQPGETNPPVPGWRFDRPLWQIDDRGVGRAVYRARGPAPIGAAATARA